MGVSFLPSLFVLSFFRWGSCVTESVVKASQLWWWWGAGWGRGELHLFRAGIESQMEEGRQCLSPIFASRLNLLFGFVQEMQLYIYSLVHYGMERGSLPTGLQVLNKA